jgi:Fe-S-cluster-containing dehydrogenase component
VWCVQCGVCTRACDERYESTAESTRPAVVAATQLRPGSDGRLSWRQLNTVVATHTHSEAIVTTMH